jgi:hypothetical protein
MVRISCLQRASFLLQLRDPVRDHGDRWRLAGADELVEQEFLSAREDEVARVRLRENALR